MSENRRRGARQAPFLPRRYSPTHHHLRPQRWNWYLLVQPLDRQLARQAEQPLPTGAVRNLRYFWIDGLFSAISENFYLGYVALYALALGATNGQIGILTAVANLLGALSLFPGARLVEQTGHRKPVVLFGAGWFGRVMLLALALVPLFFGDPLLALGAVIILNGLRAFGANLANPGWTALVADLVPDFMRGRYLSSRNMAMGLAALLVAPFAGRLINLLNARTVSELFGFQTIFLLAFGFGMVSTLAFRRIHEPEAVETQVKYVHRRGDLRRLLRLNPAFTGLVFSAFVWNLALQLAGPFFNVYLVQGLGGTTAAVGILAAVSSLSALVGQRLFGRLLDVQGALRIQLITGFLIPGLPLAWMFVTAPWQVALINIFGGFLWAGYNLSNFNLLLELTPNDQRPRAVALFQTAVFASAVIGPLLGGYLADLVSFDLIFGLSGLGRLLGMVLFALITVRALRRRSAVEETGIPS